MHLFQTPWLHNARRSAHTPRRTGTARRIALLLQEEAEKKPALQLEAAPTPVLVEPAVAAATSIAA